MKAIREPLKDCDLCPRLHCFIAKNREKFPDKFNAPVPSWGQISTAQLLIVGLAPGLKGANFTGRPFTGDFAGELLYGTLIELGLATGQFKANVDDGLQLVNTRITNAVRCVPPENKPNGHEINTCRQFLKSEIETLPSLRVVFCLGRISHESVLKATGSKLSEYPFVHGKVHHLKNGLVLIDSYHCSKYNTSTKRLTAPMFVDAVKKCLNFID